MLRIAELHQVEAHGRCLTDTIRLKILGRGQHALDGSAIVGRGNALAGGRYTGTSRRLIKLDLGHADDPGRISLPTV
jgi:hypothetical protein